MASVNKVILVGHLGRDPETRYLSNGDAVCNITVATSESWKDKNSGEKKETTEWHRVVLFRKLGEIAAQYLKKGSLVYIEGKLQTRKWQDKESGQDRYSTEVVADGMKMLGGRSPTGTADFGASSTGTGSGAASPSPAPEAGKFDDFPDDIPF